MGVDQRILRQPASFLVPEAFEKPKRTIEECFDDLTHALSKSPYRTEACKAAGITMGTLAMWIRKGKERGDDSLYSRLASYIERIEEVWVQKAEEELYRQGSTPQHEYIIDGTCIDDQTGTPLKVRKITRPPDTSKLEKWLKRKRPEHWDNQPRAGPSGVTNIQLNVLMNPDDGSD